MKQINIFKRPFLFFVLIAGLFLTACRERLSVVPEGPVKTVSILLPEDADTVMNYIAEILTARIEERCNAKVNRTGDGDLKIDLIVKPGIGVEGFCIDSSRNGHIQITGNDLRGVLYGVGKLLHNSTYSADGFTAGKWRGTSVPEKPVRGMYLATHFYNYYQTAPVKEVQRYIEDLALWGVNTILVWYDMHHFNGFESPEATAFRDRLKRFLETAKKLDVGVGFTMVGNEGYGNSPVKLQAVPGGSRGAVYPTDICPKKPEAMEYILKTKNEFFNWCRDLKPEYICIWPYDPGGCGSADCQPWGSNGFVKCASALSVAARKQIPGVKIIISTWYFDSTEWKGLGDKMAADHSWADMVLAEKSDGDKKGIFGDAPGNLPMVGFPEISMYNTFPWGGFGATPLPNHLLGQWQQVQDKLAGGFPYSEGIFDDISKVVYAGLYWNSAIPVEETLKEYIAYEYAPEARDSILKVIRILEQNHHMRWWPGELDGVKLTLDWFPSKGVKPQADPGAEEAYAIVKQTNKTLPERVRQSWRWRILYIRAMLDAELKTNGGSPNAACINGFKELMRIYHTTEKSDPVVKPPIPGTQND